MSMPFKITAGMRKAASELGVVIRQSTNPTKKLDAFTQGGEFITAFGARGYKDYHSYRETEGQEVANRRRKAYKARHEKDRHVKYRNGKLTAGYLADKILW